MAGVASAGVEELQADFPRKCPGRAVANLHRNLHYVPLAEEPGHDRLDHEVLGSHGRVEERAGAEARIVGERLELPGGERVGEGELDRHAAVVVARQGRQKERRLDEVFPRRRRSGGSRVRRWRRPSPVAHSGEVHLKAEGDRRPLGHRPARGRVSHHRVGHHRRRHRHRAAHHPPAVEPEELH